MGTRTSGGFEPLEKKIKQEFFPGKLFRKWKLITRH